jgi:hypothetical protein
MALNYFGVGQAFALSVMTLARKMVELQFEAQYVPVSLLLDAYGFDPQEIEDYDLNEGAVNLKVYLGKPKGKLTAKTRPGAKGFKGFATLAAALLVPHGRPVWENLFSVREWHVLAKNFTGVGYDIKRPNTLL